MASAVAVTTGEPAGVGPDIALSLFSGETAGRLSVLADPDVLAERARLLGIKFDPADYIGNTGGASLIPIRAPRRVEPGRPDPKNAPYVLEQIERATSGCVCGEFSALVTGPVNKGVISAGGTFFSGHTELLRNLASVDDTTMMFVNSAVRLALVTTHLPLSKVADTIGKDLVLKKIRAVAKGMKDFFSIEQPVVRVTGLNPHAGEGGLLGSEEKASIAPAIEEAGELGYMVEGPVPADTAMIPEALSPACAILSMFHDQCLPAAKALDFHGTVNVTLGLPFPRTSVDHGTAEGLAGTGKASSLNMLNAIRMAVALSDRRR